jgi:hypothetical protein
MKTAQTKILELQPHNLFLAEETLTSLRARLRTGWKWHPIEVVAYKGVEMTYNGDHRLYLAYERGDTTIEAKVYNLSDPSDRHELCQKEYDKWCQFITIGRNGITNVAMLVQFYEEWGTEPKGDEFDSKRFRHIIGFMKHNNVRSIADVSFKPTKTEIELAYEALDKEYRTYLREHSKRPSTLLDLGK